MDINKERTSLLNQRKGNLEILNYLLSFQKGDDKVEAINILYS